MQIIRNKFDMYEYILLLTLILCVTFVIVIDSIFFSNFNKINIHSILRLTENDIYTSIIFAVQAYQRLK